MDDRNKVALFMQDIMSNIAQSTYLRHLRGETVSRHPIPRDVLQIIENHQNPEYMRDVVEKMIENIMHEIVATVFIIVDGSTRLSDSGRVIFITTDPESSVGFTLTDMWLDVAGPDTFSVGSVI